MKKGKIYNADSKIDGIDQREREIDGKVEMEKRMKKSFMEPLCKY